MVLYDRISLNYIHFFFNFFSIMHLFTQMLTYRAVQRYETLLFWILVKTLIKLTSLVTIQTAKMTSIPLLMTAIMVITITIRSILRFPHRITLLNTQRCPQLLSFPLRTMLFKIQLLQQPQNHKTQTMMIIRELMQKPIHKEMETVTEDNSCYLY